MRRCKGCNIEKSLIEFTVNKASVGGRLWHCKSCRQIQSKLWHRKNREKNRARFNARMREYGAQWPLRIRDMNLKRRFGMSLEIYEKMLERQGGVCLICSDKETHKLRGKVIPLAVDHCHVSGKIRGLLCKNCNTALGSFKDNPFIIGKALEYISQQRVLP